eukprot:TRINITY_DN7673_c0_g1_i2.p1 TRINITY_DN7673_c0_g1~~TRINITY_DN7673_c0_g1_i2.p1  ORF type:complete len:260 (+),score=20.73 TRINITY_DN7673_c0_g1_i2:33-812(+)
MLNLNCVRNISSCSNIHIGIRKSQRHNSYNLHNLFKPSESLSIKTKSKKPHFVFLEGVAGTGKADVIWRLHKLGYTVSTNTFFNHCENFTSKNEMIDQKGLFCSLSWLNLQTQFIQKISEDGSIPKDNLVVLHRSPLSLWVHDQGVDALNLVKELKMLYNISFIYCWSDPTRIQERVGERNYWSTGKTKKLYEQFDEENTEIQKRYEQKYIELQEKGIFEGSLPTTSSKQATANLLTLCGVDFNPVFDTSTLKMQHDKQ